MEKNYTSDLTDAEWQVIKSKMSGKTIRRKRKYDLYIILNAILYILKNGCLWRDLPKDFPPYRIVYYYFNKWKKDGTWNLIHQDLYEDCREQAGKESSPSVGLLDSQSVKTDAISSQEDCGVDVGKKIKGRKRHIIVDTMGLIIAVVVHSAGIQDRDGARLVLNKLLANHSLFVRMKVIMADAAYGGPKLGDWFSTVFKSFNWLLKVFRRPKHQVGFEVNSMLWIVERTFAWLSNSRRLSKDYERRTDTSEAFIQIAMIKLMARRLALHHNITRVSTKI